ncbi:MAG: hypothetical protein NT038_07720 [Euryarchaeota archaeon]|nr:hypothetical protein [Euryarchaeota archaeon]
MEIDIGILLLYASITILSLILLAATLVSYVKSKNKKLIFVNIIFLFLLIRGLLLSISLFVPSLSWIPSNGYIWVGDLLVLLFLYIAYSVKR